MHKLKPRLSAHLRLALIPLIASALTVSAARIVARTEGSKANKVGRSESTAPLVPPEMMDAAKWTYIIESSLANQRRADLAHRIDCYFDARHSPMVGLGSYIVTSAERYGHDPRLCAAIAEAESSCGLACFAQHNAWGMLAYGGGFASWEAGVDAMFDWLFKYNGVCASAPLNWCEPPHPWMENVQRVMESI